MKILIVSFYDDNNMMYPHLQTVMNLLNKTHDVNYFKFEERGYTFAQKMNLKLLRRTLRIVFKDTKALKKEIYDNKYDKVIVIDHFTYVITSFIIPKEKLLFWSFDIMGDDSTYYKSLMIRLILKLNSLFLKRNNTKVIIQCKERLNILERTLKYKIPEKNICFLPVFVQYAEVVPTYKLMNKMPVLMQITSFDGQRYTDELINQYQVDNNYHLYLHGLYAKELSQNINNNKKTPIISYDLVPPMEVYKIVMDSDIGFLGLKLKEDNCKYLYNASGQLLEFLRLGKPVISLGDNNVGRVLQENHAGIEINDINDLSNAIDIIKNDYENYSNKAYELFKRDFNSEKIMNNLISFLEK